MKKLFLFLLIAMLCLSVIGCGAAGPKATELDTIEIDYYETPIIQFGLPKDGSYEVSEFDLNDGLRVVNGDFLIGVMLEKRQQYIDGSAVWCSFQEMKEFRGSTDPGYRIADVTYSRMDGFSQDMGFGRMLLYFPIADSLQKDVDRPRVLEILIAHNPNEPKSGSASSDAALAEYMETEELQMILNSFQLLPGN